MSGDNDARSLSSADNACLDTPRCTAAVDTFRSFAAMTSSRKNSPGCTGRIISMSTLIVIPLSVVVFEIQLFNGSIGYREGQSPILRNVQTPCALLDPTNVWAFHVGTEISSLGDSAAIRNEIIRRSFGATSEGNPLGSSSVISRFRPLWRMERRTININTATEMQCQVTRYGLQFQVMHGLQTCALMSP